ncbi:MAG TPA: tRNA pseudouridine(55) synthase TruB [Burkholderiales bacterium]|nr:tRNA pseudouridine(55) synthase TruB [Burkholderiales bacterium]
MSAKKERRKLDGVLLLDKPPGITSQGAVSRAKRLFGAAKAGHTGTLDPMATGLLPLAFGEATKFAHSLLDADKAYVADVRFGVTTTTGDLEGDVVSTKPVDLDEPRLLNALARFRGEIVQVPPMYSALKHQGKPLYEYARAGTEIVREPRRITIHALELDSFAGDTARIRVWCSKGTYIRVLAEDIGETLGCGATLAALRRTAVGPFSVEAATTLEALEAVPPDERAGALLPADTLVRELPAVALDAGQARRLGLGQSVSGLAAGAGLVRAYGPAGAFLGVCELSTTGVLAPRRLLATS